MATYGNVYVAQISFGANPSQAIKAMIEAESYNGPSLIIAYSTCIAHGIDMSKSVERQKLAVSSGYWPLYRYNPLLEKEGKNPMQLDCKDPSTSLGEFEFAENRYRALKQMNPAVADQLLKEAEQDVKRRWNILKHWSNWSPV